MNKIQQLSVTLLCIALPFSASAEQSEPLQASANAQTSTNTTNAQAALAISALDMIPLLTSSLGVNQNQAEGGLGSLFAYAKEQLSSTEATQLSNALPDLETLVNMAPAVEAQKEQQGGFGGLLSVAAQYNDSLKSIDQLNQQFQTLGLKPEMIGQFANTAIQYLNSSQGQQAGTLLQQSLSAFL